MSATFTIYNAAKFEIEICKSCDPKVGWLELSVTEVDGATHEITIHFDTAEGFALASRLHHLEKAITNTEEAVS